MVDFYGLEIFLAETSATCGGLDSLLEPTGPLREAQQLAAQTFGSRQTYFVTNGTSTANKIVVQALVQPGDIVLVDRNCHQSHHYGLMLAGAMVTYLDAYRLNQYSMYGAVSVREIKSQLLALRRAGKLDRVRMLLLTNCTFDGIVYDVQRVMQECLAIKPDLIFLWDEAWFAFARFHPVYRPRTAMRAARTLAETLRLPEYRAEYDAFLDEVGAIDAADDDVLMSRRLLPDPARARVRVYSTQSTHKTLTSLRQGSMIHIWDQDFSQKVEETFHEAYMTHTSTSPNYQILASLDLGRRQAALEGFELVQKQIENAMRLRDAVDTHPLLSKYMRCLTTADLIPAEHRPTEIDQPLRSGLPNMIKAWEGDEFVLDPSRVTIFIGQTGIEGDTFKRSHLMDRFGVQINKTSRNTVLFMTTIGTSRSSVAYLIEVLVTIARELDTELADMSLAERAAHERAVHRLTAPSAPLPDFSGFHPSFTDGQGVPTSDGDVRRAFYLSYNDSYCEYLMPDEVEQRVENGDQVVSTTYVTPYPPGFPVLVPGQVFSRQILAFMRSLDTPEVHGYRPELGYRVYVDKALEIAATARPAPPPNPAGSLGSAGLADPVEPVGSPGPAAPASGRPGLLRRAGPAQAEAGQRVAQRVHRRLDEVVPDDLRGLLLGRADQRAGDLRIVRGLVKGQVLRLRVEHRHRELRLEQRPAPEPRIGPAVLRIDRVGQRVVDRDVVHRLRQLRLRQHDADRHPAGLTGHRAVQYLQPVVPGRRTPPGRPRVEVDRRGGPPDRGERARIPAWPEADVLRHLVREHEVERLRPQGRPGDALDLLQHPRADVGIGGDAGRY